MRKLFLIVTISYIQTCFPQDYSGYANTKNFKLAEPQLFVSSVFFKDSAFVQLAFNLPEAIIRFSLDGSPIGENSTSYEGKIRLQESALISAKVFHPDFETSDVLQMKVLKIDKNQNIKSVSIKPEPSEPYAGLGAKGLFDLRKGAKNFISDKQWLGFQSDSIVVNAELSGKTPISKLIVSSLTNHSSWIFSPEKIAVFSKGKLIGTTTFEDLEQETKAKFNFQEVKFEKGDYSSLVVIIYPLKAIPEWHQGKGTLPWLFIDELIIQ